ncbi:MAG: nucleotidyltransferase domain-containing protein [Gemmatimonadetes bacterium]|nr:nucleotidyltransferase domain-containing protein [Candidatus Palauibacter australiensis]
MADAKQPATQNGGCSVDDSTLDEIIRRIVAVSQPEKVILFGSAARNEMGPHSDIDLLVIKPALREGRVIYDAA